MLLIPYRQGWSHQPYNYSTGYNTGVRLVIILLVLTIILENNFYQHLHLITLDSAILYRKSMKFGAKMLNNTCISSRMPNFIDSVQNGEQLKVSI